MNNKILVLFSGGIDSTVCLLKAINEVGKENVLAISFNYNQTNIKELDSAIEICKYYDVKYEIIDIKNIFNYSNSSLIKSSNKKIPHESYDKQYLKMGPNDELSTNVSFRNGVMISICSSIAQSKKIKTVYTSIHKNNNIYPDNTRDFIVNMSLAVSSGTNNKVNIISPLIDMEKKDIIKLGRKLNIPFEKTWTCYENNDYPCKECIACIERLKSFKDNNLIDPLN